MSRVNVVFMGNLLYPEGLAETKRFQHFIDGVMAGEGNSAQVLLLRQGHPGRDVSRLAGENRGVHYQTIGQDISAGPGLPLAVLRYLIGGGRFLRRARRKDGGNVLFLYGEPNLENILFVIWARLLGFRVIVDIVEDRYFITEGASLLSRLKAWSVTWTTGHMHWFADGVVVISGYLRTKLELIVGRSHPVQLIPISVDLDRITSSGQPFHHPVRMLYAGSFGDKDAVEVLIAAFEQVAASRPDMEFLMTGRGAPERMAAVQRRIDASPLASRIRHLGYLSDDEYFRAISDCDIPCVVRVPSEFAERGFPFKLGEYLASGRPVIATRIGDVTEYLQDRVSAVLVDAGSSTAIAAALEFLLEDENRALAIGRAGRAVAEECFSARQVGERFRGFVEQVASR